MNRRQLLRGGALAATGLTVTGTKLLMPGSTSAQKPVQSAIDPQDDTPRFGSKPGTLYPIAVSVPSSKEGRSHLLQVTELTESKLLSLPATEKVTLFASQDKTLTKEELKDQYIVFQFVAVGDQSALIESSKVQPTVQTTTENPDIALSVNLESFHLADSENVDPDTKASVRLTIGEDESSSGVSEPLYWAISAGLNLYNSQKNQKSLPSELKSNFKQVLNNRPIGLQGAIGTMRFEIIKHSKPSWWERIFQFAKSDPGKLLISALGFPAIVEQAVNFVDEAASRFENAKPQTLMASQKLTFAFSQQARDAYVAGGPVKIGVLNKGRWILARGRDYATLSDAKAWYYGTYGKLVPAGVTAEQVVTGYTDPFANISYAILNANSTATKINPLS